MMDGRRHGDFSQLRLWRLLVYLVFLLFISHILAGIVGGIIGYDWVEHLTRLVILYLWGFRYVRKTLSRSQVKPSALLKPIPAEFGPKKMVGLLWGALTVNGGLGFLTVALWLVFLPQLLEMELHSGLSPTSNIGVVLGFVEIVILAPIFEEFIFRGIVFGYAEQKWNAKTALVLSSLIFALGHSPNLFGPLFVGWTLSLLYFRTRTLIAPILLHMANNLFGWLMGLASTPTPSTMPEVSELSHLVVLGVTLLVAGLGPLVYFIKESFIPRDTIVGG